MPYVLWKLIEKAAVQLPSPKSFVNVSLVVAHLCGSLGHDQAQEEADTLLVPQLREVQLKQVASLWR
jgi:hypothetical protein